MRKSHAFLLFLLICLTAVSALVMRSEREVAHFSFPARDLEEITASLKLTDLSFSNDARYTRSPSQADLFSAFQDYPGSIEHFPSGSVMAPPDFSRLSTKITVVKR